MRDSRGLCTTDPNRADYISHADFLDHWLMFRDVIDNACDCCQTASGPYWGTLTAYHAGANIPTALAITPRHWDLSCDASPSFCQ